MPSQPNTRGALLQLPVDGRNRCVQALTCRTSRRALKAPADGQ